nr:immunoglobulin heavy chain junction region [Mus musculus]MBK4185580.1 immunoglobulin heavy chain junction region [Mus musculus]MBK4185581.1 immunoglobulin heavy chain junction region [Mus musculus]MBK4185582.1 immunoglobulin heavy chain junction region [Mus musculus]MBK4185584.1 immunoglobulin heavy chain junction region [Mus musculus]
CARRDRILDWYFDVW